MTHQIDFQFTVEFYATEETISNYFIENARSYSDSIFCSYNVSIKYKLMFLTFGLIIFPLMVI